MIERAKQPSSLLEPTLGNLLRETAYARMPARFYWLLQTCVPWALQAWAWGWPRTAGWLGVASTFGLWAIAEQHITGYAAAIDSFESRATTRLQLWRAVRAGASFVGIVGSGVMLIDLFLQLLSATFKCPGCAG